MYSEGFGLEVVEIEVHHRFWQGFFTAQIYINYVYNIFLWGFGGGGGGGYSVDFWVGVCHCDSDPH